MINHFAAYLKEVKWLYCLFCMGVMPHKDGICQSCGSFNDTEKK